MGIIDSDFTHFLFEANPTKNMNIPIIKTTIILKILTSSLSIYFKLLTQKAIKQINNKKIRSSYRNSACNCSFIFFCKSNFLIFPLAVIGN